MTTLNNQLLKEAENPFQAYLLFSNSANYLIDQAQKFSSLILFNNLETFQHPDIRLIKSENLNTIGIENIRDVIGNDSLVPIEGRYKIVIIPPFKSLTEEASNALLKTIEEPSNSSIFIILSSGNFWTHGKSDSENFILTTIKSRCRTLFLNSDTEFTFDYSSKDLISFLDVENLNERNLKDDFEEVVKILRSLEKDNNDSYVQLASFYKLIDVCKEIVKKFPEEDKISLNFLIVQTLKYYSFCLIKNKNMDKTLFNYLENIEDSMKQISLGARPLIVLSSFSVGQLN